MKAQAHIVYDNESELIRKCVEWDRRAQQALYDRFSSRMYAVCYRYSRDREEAEDILQEGFMKVFEKIHTFKQEGSLEGWVRRIMVNTAIQKYREKKPSAGLLLKVEHYPERNEGSKDAEALSKLGTDELIVLLQSLSPAYQMVFNLYVFEGLKHREIAERLGISEGTSKSNLSDARKILQKEIMKRDTARELAGYYGRG